MLYRFEKKIAVFLGKTFCIKIISFSNRFYCMAWEIRWKQISHRNFYFNMFRLAPTRHLHIAHFRKSRTHQCDYLPPTHASAPFLFQIIFQHTHKSVYGKCTKWESLLQELIGLLLYFNYFIYIYLITYRC